MMAGSETSYPAAIAATAAVSLGLGYYLGLQHQHQHQLQAVQREATSSAAAKGKAAPGAAGSAGAATAAARTKGASRREAPKRSKAEAQNTWITCDIIVAREVRDPSPHVRRLLRPLPARPAWRGVAVCGHHPCRVREAWGP